MERDVDEGALIEQTLAAQARGRVLFVMGGQQYDLTPVEARNRARKLLAHCGGMDDFARALLAAADRVESRRPSARS